MSLKRLIYYSALVGGWAAFVGWLASESGLSNTFRESMLGVGIVAALVGAAIGGGLNLLAGLANGQLLQQVKRLVPGLILGGLGGLIGGLVANFGYQQLNLPRALGWMLMGAAIGVVEGVYERSKSKIRNGLIGGLLGGLLGGFLFEPIAGLFQTSTGMSSRATAFVLLGLCIGALIGIVQVVLREAWLTVEDGWRSGRQLILSKPITVLGRGDHLPLPLLGPSNKDVELEHARITRRADGVYEVENLSKKLGTRLNHKPLDAASALGDGDLIKIGTNLIRFRERAGQRTAEMPTTTASPTKASPAPPPPPPLKRGPDAPAAAKKPNLAHAVAPNPAPPPPPTIKPMPPRSTGTQIPPPPPPAKKA